MLPPELPPDHARLIDETLGYGAASIKSAPSLRALLTRGDAG